MMEIDPFTQLAIWVTLFVGAIANLIVLLRKPKKGNNDNRLGK